MSMSNHAATDRRLAEIPPFAPGVEYGILDLDDPTGPNGLADTAYVPLAGDALRDYLLAALDGAQS